MPEQTYVEQLAAELRTRRPDVMRAAEDELKRLRLQLSTVAHFINNPTHDHAARTALAKALGLPAPGPR